MKIFAVDNNSIPLSRQKLDNLSAKYPDKISVIKLNKNTGSANGFKIGLEAAINEFEFIWLLDDDNYPNDNALNELVQFWNKNKNQNELLCLASFREGWDTFRKSVLTGNPDGPLLPKNGFRDFHVSHFSKKLLMKILRLNPLNLPEKNIEFGELSVVPYGGMFFNVELILKIGLPNPDFYLYHDDYDFSFRIKKSNGKTILLLKSCIESLEQSWHAKMAGPEFYKLSRVDNPIRLYYQIRNKLVFELSEIVLNKWIYYFNMTIFSILFIFSCMIFLNFGNILIYLNAIYDGLKGNLGENKKFSNNFV